MAKTGPSRLRPLTLRLLTAPVRAHFTFPSTGRKIIDTILNTITRSLVQDSILVTSTHAY
ncbi:Putative protein without homology [Lactobacillus rhamnosus GG] [Lacticaseibacillus rhamnosus]|uniref:Uncharacterized protein n=2 Tax=Lacticaseibacillus rhamnosus TaxID=47715 RepID=A0A6N2Z9P3_LACRH|nr:hypothetical protein LRHMDP2_2253 [Lacticaseibacillus rhamnosus LRHMDP2]EKS50262.1 hypothetical protein LRHMDP3_1791 [Lacticaseibacillus rhamnosus LRHMDP3]CAR88513.1 Putative protein without homology [Lacticaseibacillus rhamnosus GG]VTU49144.1 Putative protein without homology [Lactobacillus rhamnosus GG] [Lacticaseibacillus rhamnosus]VTU55753.1 Putative protein without homology [Lactobacillus rhamnosus GG] [Lacticaseibacillus rhamnosus]